jgi:Fe-S-cluster containining protein
VNAMDKRQRSEKHDWLVSKTQSILKHYSCPESCNANCCKTHIIDFHRKEYEKILRNIDKESANILKSNAVKSELEGCYKAINAVGQCPLLINSKCRIYDNRPEACRIFPFVIFRDEEAGFGLTLLLCPMSVNIIQDYVQWYKPVNSTMYGRLNALYEQYKNIDKNNDFSIQMKEQNLDSFIEFLERK